MESQPTPEELRALIPLFEEIKRDVKEVERDSREIRRDINTLARDIDRVGRDIDDMTVRIAEQRVVSDEIARDLRMLMERDRRKTAWEEKKAKMAQRH